jgi:hypothetical protein
MAAAFLFKTTWTKGSKKIKERAIGEEIQENPKSRINISRASEEENENDELDDGLDDLKLALAEALKNNKDLKKMPVEIEEATCNEHSPADASASDSQGPEAPETKLL